MRARSQSGSDPTRSVSNAVISLLESVAEIDAITEEVGLQTGLSIRTIVEHGAGIGKAAEVKVAQAQESDCHSQTERIRPQTQVWDMTGGKCAYCTQRLRLTRTGRCPSWSRHVVPTSQGESPDNLANYVLACMSCNTSKGADHVLLFIQRRFPNRAGRRSHSRRHGMTYRRKEVIGPHALYWRMPLCRNSAARWMPW